MTCAMGFVHVGAGAPKTFSGNYTESATTVNAAGMVAVRAVFANAILVIGEFRLEEFLLANDTLS